MSDDAIPLVNELRTLLEKRTPGVWRANVLGSVDMHRRPILRSARSRMSVDVRPERPLDHLHDQANIRLAALAPVLAETLIAQSERLEAFYGWARGMCAQTCSGFPKHAPNCPVADLRLGD